MKGPQKDRFLRQSFVSNIFGTLSELIEDLDDLIGARIVRRRTLVKHLVGQANENHFPSDIFYIERKVREDSISITFALASPLDLEGLQLPKRVITQNYCVWKYRGDECGYNGDPVADQFNNPISTDCANTQAERDYNDAFSTYETKRKEYQTKLAERSAKQTERDLACRGSSGETFGGFNEDDKDKISFALPGMNDENDDNKQVTMVVFEGDNVTDLAEPNANAQYKMDTSKRITTPYDNYGTGPLYTIKISPCSMAFAKVLAQSPALSEKELRVQRLLLTQDETREDQILIQTATMIWKTFAVYEGSPVTLSTTGEYGLGTKQGSDDDTQIDPVRFVQKIEAGKCAEKEGELDDA